MEINGQNKTIFLYSENLENILKSISYEINYDLVGLKCPNKISKPTAEAPFNDLKNAILWFM